MPEFTKSQQNVISYRGKNLLVSASAGTGKTTVMIERIASLIAEGQDVSSLVVVTFTNLAASEMKKRLAAKLAERRNDPRVREQLEKLDNASICTLHSFCSELLRNYFYVVDVDPSFSILDGVTVAALRKTALDEVFKRYFRENDQLFKKVYKIFSTGRKDDKFRETLLSLYDFGGCLENFGDWYRQTRQNFLVFEENNPVMLTLCNDVKQNSEYFCAEFKALAEKCVQEGLFGFADVCVANSQKFNVDFSDFQTATDSLAKLSLLPLPNRNAKKDFGADKTTEERVRGEFDWVKDDAKKFCDKYAKLRNGKTVEQLWEESKVSVLYTDKLVEILERFEEEFSQQKKRRGGLDFGDLERLTLRLLNDEVADAVCDRYKFVFVDEYQDTNPVQEAIIAKLSARADLFMVGDVKQSIYGFRGCDPTIFLNKYTAFKQTDCGRVEELNANFRSNAEILHFVNDLFDRVMTQDFGKVDYARTARLEGKKPPLLKTPSVQIDLVVKQKNDLAEISDVYDVTQKATDKTAVTQGEVIAEKINGFVGMAYKDKHGNPKRINYGDVVILVRNLKDRAVDIYNALVERNIPVMANFKTTGYANKEVRELVNLMRAVDNPYNDVYFVGVCLSCIGGFTEDMLAQVKIATDDRRAPFYTRMQMYVGSAKNDDISVKIDKILAYLEQLRFFADSATVDEFVLKVLADTKYHLYVQGLPNGALRLKRLYAFVDSLKGASYAQSVAKFLSYLDEADEGLAEEGLSNTNAVRLMTMHASKGLEFPIVIVAGTETGFNYDYPAVVRNAKLGLATRYYDFDKMRASNTLGATACGMFNRTTQQEEEMRLLYVALTRAETVLNVVGTVAEAQLSAMPKRPEAANSHLDWLLTALKNKYGKLEGVATDEQICVVREISSQQNVRENLLCEQSNDMADLENRLNFRYPFADQTQMPSKIVSSALDKEFIDVDESRAEYVLVENDKNFVGTAYHKVYQYVNYDADKQAIAQTIEGLVHECKVEERYAKQLDVDLIFQTLNNADLRRLTAQGKVYREMPFMLYVPYDSVAKDKRFSDTVMLQGVIDLLILNKDFATVVDFKYTSKSNLVKQNYAAQLNSYRLAVQNICGVQDVACYVLSIADNKLIKM